MTKRIFKSICIVAICVLFALLFLFTSSLYEYFTEHQREQLSIQTELAAQAMNNEGEQYLEGLNTERYRLTWIAADGTVLYDSDTDAAEMGNHLNREEITLALKEGYGESARSSDTMILRYLYSAQRLDDGTVLRLSVPQTTLPILLLNMSQSIAVVLIIALILSFLLAYRLSKQVVRPLNELNLDKPLENNEYEEITPLLKRIASQQKQLKAQEEKLHRRKKEFEAVTSNMNEGLILLNTDAEILSINPSAARILHSTNITVGEDIKILGNLHEMKELVKKAATGEAAEWIINIEGRDYQFDLSPVYSKGVISGAVLLLIDKTEKLRGEKMRREFTANVSHELKTPLHSILGYAELIHSGIAKQEDVQNFAGKIHSESQRMISLIEDIIRLSHLDEGDKNIEKLPVSLLTLSKKVQTNLLPQAQAAGISFKVEGCDCTVTGVTALIEGMIYNLCDNAIKYNKKHGNVTITINETNTHVLLTVADTGIGIPAEHLDRIFARFYRVDKSRSKEVGGTGLGLSIVKHSAIIHNAEIELKSTVDVGTQITVKFEKNSVK